MKRLLPTSLLLLALVACGQSHASTAGGSATVDPIPTSAAPSASPSPSGETTVQGPVKVVRDDSGIPGVVAYKTVPPGGSAEEGALTQDHVDGPVTYAVSPPVGGPHAPVWLNCGTYATTPPIENAVHDLEHGAVMITYLPHLPATDEAALKALVARQPAVTVTISGETVDTHLAYVDLFPFADQTSPIVITSWGRRLAVTSPSDPRLQRFIDAFRVSKEHTPEYGASCSGGVGTPTG